MPNTQYTIEGALQLGLDFYYKEEYGKAESVLGQIINGYPDNIEAWQILAHVYQKSARLPDAYASISKAIEIEPGFDGLHIFAADLAKQSKRFDVAEGHYKQAIAIGERANSSAKPEYYMEYGKFLQYYVYPDAKANGTYPDALTKITVRSIDQYFIYLNLRPEDHGIRNDVALSLADVGRLDEAVEQYKLAIRDGNIKAGLNFALLLGKIGQEEESVNEQVKLLEILNKRTDDESLQLTAALYNNLGAAIDKLQNGNRSLAIEMWQNAIAINPNMIPALDSLGNKLIADNDLDGAVDLLRRAELAAIAANDLDRANAARSSGTHLYPPFYKSVDDVVRMKFRYSGQLEGLLQRARKGKLFISKPEEAITDIGFHFVSLGFHEHVSRAQLAEVLRLSAPYLQYTAPHIVQAHGKDVLFERFAKTPDLTPKNRLRVGFFSSFFREHSVGKLLRGVIRELAKIPVFEVFVIVPDINEDSFTAEIGQSANYFIRIKSDSYSVVREAIGKLNLDILVFGELGMSSTAYLTAFSRLAHRQVVFWGHGVTTGLPEMDYFITSAKMETQEAQAHYTERLYLMPSICTYFLPPILPAPNLKEEDFGIPMEYFGAVRPHLYLIPTSLYKLNPLMDEAIRKVLTRDPHGLLILVKGKLESSRMFLTERFRQSMSDSLVDRIVWVNGMHLDRYLAFIKLGAVIMFTYPSASGVTVMEAASVGTPFVVYEGLSLGMTMRIEKGYVRELGINESCCVAHTIDDFVDKIVKFGVDPHTARK